MDNTFRYTNKGTVYEFDTNVLSDDEKQKFRKLNDRDKVKFIAARELEHDTTFPKAYSVQAVYNEPQNEKYNKYVIGATKLDDLKNFLGEYYDKISTPLILKTKDDIDNALYEAYLKKMFPIIKEGVQNGTWENLGNDNYNEDFAGAWQSLALPITNSKGITIGYHPLSRNEFFEKINYTQDDNEYEKEKRDAIWNSTPLSTYKYAYYFNVPRLLASKNTQHITMSDIDKLLSVKPNATFQDLKNMFEDEMKTSNVYTPQTISLSDALKNILKITNPDKFKQSIINPVNKSVVEYIIKMYPDDKDILKAALENNLPKVDEKMKEKGDKEGEKLVEENKKEAAKTAEQIKIMSDCNKATNEENKNIKLDEKVLEENVTDKEYSWGDIYTEEEYQEPSYNPNPLMIEYPTKEGKKKETKKPPVKPPMPKKKTITKMSEAETTNDSKQQIEKNLIEGNETAINKYVKIINDFYDIDFEADEALISTNTKYTTKKVERLGLLKWFTDDEEIPISVVKNYTDIIKTGKLYKTKPDNIGKQKNIADYFRYMAIKKILRTVLKDYAKEGITDKDVQKFLTTFINDVNANIVYNDETELKTPAKNGVIVFTMNKLKDLVNPGKKDFDYDQYTLKENTITKRKNNPIYNQINEEIKNQKDLYIEGYNKKQSNYDADISTPFKENELKTNALIENPGAGVGGKFLNRFKDFEPDINRLENKINNLENILLRLEEDFKKKESEEKVKEEKIYNPTQPEPEQEVPEGYIPLKPQPNSLPFSAADLSQGASSLRSFIPYVKPENEEQNDILNILRKRRQDIEPDEYEDSEEEDWGAGSKKIKLIKFINKHKLKKRFKIKDSSSSDDSSTDEEEEEED